MTDYEPPWVQAGYATDSYQAMCRMCGTVAELSFGSGESKLLTVRYKDEVNQEQLFAFVFYWTLEKLRRECDCTEEERKDYERPFE